MSLNKNFGVPIAAPPTIPGYRNLNTARIQNLRTDNILGNYTSWKKNVKVATTVNITLTGGQTIDGILVTVGDRVLVKDQTLPVENGLYVVGNVSWERTTDMEPGIDASGSSVVISEGTTNDNKIFVCTNAIGDGIVGTNDLVFSEITGAAGGAAGLNTEVQYNSGGLLTGDSGLTYISGSGNLRATSVSGLAGDDLTIVQGSNTFLWPTTTPVINEFLQVTNGSSPFTLDWSNATGTPGTPVNSLQYNSAGSFAGSSTLTFDGSNTITFGTEAVTSNLQAPTATTTDTVGGKLTMTSGDGLGTGDGGFISVLSGTGGATGNSGLASFGSGNASSSTNSGDVGIASGSGFDTGDVGIVTSGSANSTSGDIIILTGSTAVGGSGDIIILTGSSSSSEGGDINITSGSSGGANSGGAIGITAGVGGSTAGVGGALTLSSGNGGTGGNSGLVTVKSGTSSALRGGVMVGGDSADLLGFYGTEPITIPNITATATTIQNIVDALVALGLVTNNP